MKKFVEEFKNFAIKGNMVDMAIGIIIGTAFNNVVNTLVKQVVMPPLNLVTGGIKYANQKWILQPGSDGVDEIAIGYGLLVEVVLDFLIVALTIFVVVKMMNRFRAKAEDPKNVEVETPKNIELLSNIEKLMEEQNNLLRKQI